MKSKEELQQYILQLKGRKLELDEEQKMVNNELMRAIGQMEVLLDIEKQKELESLPLVEVPK